MNETLAKLGTLIETANQQEIVMAEQGWSGWAVVELMGHLRIAGLVSEEVRFGESLIRVDVPATDTHAAFTDYYSPKALYRFVPTDEATARAVAAHERRPPIAPLMLPTVPQPAIEYPDPEDDPEDEQESWD